jgi:hypothetical protein
MPPVLCILPVLQASRETLSPSQLIVLDFHISLQLQKRVNFIFTAICYRNNNFITKPRIPIHVSG